MNLLVKIVLQVQCFFFFFCLFVFVNLANHVFTKTKFCIYLHPFLNCIIQLPLGKSKFPVFVWIHGGSNEVGMGAMLRGDLLAARAQVIVVNLNYRLDILGECDIPCINPYMTNLFIHHYYLGKSTF